MKNRIYKNPYRTKIYLIVRPFLGKKFSIRKQLLTGFLSLTFLLLSITITSLIFLKNSDELRDVKEVISIAELDMIRLLNFQFSFLEKEMVDDELYKNGSTPLLEKQSVLYQKIKLELNILMGEKVLENFQVGHELTLINSRLEEMNSYFHELVSLQQKRGFKNWGLEGEMRSYAHSLERNAVVPLNDLLMLRRHEKDYFLRENVEYVNKVNELSKAIQQKLKNSGHQEALTTLEKYTITFNKIVAIEKEMGDLYHSGVKDKLNMVSEEIQDLLALVNQNAAAYERFATERIRFIYFISVILSAIMSFLISIMTANKIAKPIKILTAEIKQIIQSENFIRKDLKLKNASSEVNELSLYFRKLIEKVESQLNEINHKNHDLERSFKELQQVNLELDQFVYSASHDLKAPITSALGLIQIYKLENDENQKEKYLEMLSGSLLKLKAFIEDVVTLTKNVRTSLNIEKVSLTEIIEEIFDQQKFGAYSQKVEKVIEMEGNFPVFQDKRRLFIIFNNLISNAIKYVKKDQDFVLIKISIQINPETIKFTISDNGIGIRPEHQEKVFEMFYRATSDNPGSGLGLYIVKETVKKIDGNIHMESIFGNGTTFKLDFPNYPGPFEENPLTISHEQIEPVVS
ncbi:sensor histidine kinase [Flexithrix dorotheae]|uniref:sensor histidine kinase n=1 Tax=Flexithrix dorotheae TaxID=70993 RepID=UPI00037C3744|nr:HAMP domain-containing sensor histidine kinase [Flexithrix dorotheae]